MKRKNLIIISAGFIILIGAIFIVYSSSKRTIYEKTSVDLSTNEENLVISNFRQISGNDIYLATVELEAKFHPFTSARLFRFDYGFRVRNLIFLNGKTLESNNLFPTNHQYFVDMYQFPEPNFSSEEIVKVEWLVYLIVNNDSNVDGVLNDEDQITLAISDKNGNNYSEIINNPGLVYGMYLYDSPLLLVIHGSNENINASRIDLENKVVIETKTLEGFPLNLGK